MEKYVCPNCYGIVAFNDPEDTEMQCPNCETPFILRGNEAANYITEPKIMQNIESVIHQEEREFAHKAKRIEQLREEIIRMANAKISPMYAINVENSLRVFRANYAEFEKAYYTLETVKSLLD